MNQPECEKSCNRAAMCRWTHVITVILLVYGWGLTRQINEPWTGLHDWNGAFYSQLARNLLRYPFETHHAMPFAAVGENAPEEERSFYARHPPLLVWCVAGAFAVFGESEAVARSIPIACSLAGIVLFTGLVRRESGLLRAIPAGLMASVLPMCVYYGRMVNHEPLCLMWMLAAVWAWGRCADTTPSRPSRLACSWTAGGSAAVAAWVDWAGGLFAVILSIATVVRVRQQKISVPTAVVIVGLCLAAVGSVTGYLVFIGMQGRWADLANLFFSRATSEAGVSSRAWLHHAGDNLSWFVVGLMVIGLLSAGLQRSLRPIVTPLSLITLTGLIWLVLLRRQFLLHGYWMYYLGPACCAFAARGAETIIGFFRSRLGGRTSDIAVAGMIFLTGFFAVRGTNDLFQRISISPQDVDCWRGASAMTNPTDTVWSSWNPVVRESHGATVFRNIVPAQLAYYLDRRIEVWTPEYAASRPTPHQVLFRRADWDRAIVIHDLYDWQPCGRMVIGRRKDAGATQPGGGDGR